MSDTNDHARIRALLESGRITQAEADLLFAALDEDETQRPTDEAVQVQPTQVQPAPSQQNVQPTPAVVPEPPPPLEAQLPRPPEPPPVPASAPVAVPAGWLKLLGFCGDLSVRGEPGLSTPVVTGNATLERTPEGYLIRTPPGGEEGAKGWLSRLHRAAGDVTVRLPADMGLELGIAAGDGEVRDVKTLRGNFTGGDFEVLGAEHVDLTVTAGDVTLKLNPQRGEQRVRATSGDVDIVLMAGSSVTVSGSATCGDLDVPRTFTQPGGFPGRRFGGVLGAGAARLDLRLIAGDVNVRAEGL